MSAGLRAGYKQTEVGVIPEEWEVTPLGLQVQITSGESPSLIQFTTSGKPYFKVEQLGNCEKYLGGESTPYHFRVGKTVRGNSVVFAKRGAAISLNRVRILSEDSFMDTNLMALTCLGDLDPEFLYYGLGYIGLWQFADVTSVPQINNKHVKPLCFPLPPLPEQRAIAAALSDVDALLGGLDSLIAKKKGLKVAAMQQLLTGQTRLPGFSGEWEVKRLGDAGKCLRGVSYKGDSDLSTHDTSNTKRLLRSNNVQGAIVVTDEVQYVNAARVSLHQILKKDDILICMANGSKALVGKAGVFNVSNGYEYTFGAFMGCFRTDATEANPTFAFYLFQTARYRDYINNLLAGSSINNLRPSSIESLEFDMPPALEQTAIAAILSDMDAELAALQARRSKTQALKQAMMQELLTGRIRLF
jgi:type I restriction enzyme S subunit